MKYNSSLILLQKYGLSILSIVPMRAEPDERSEMVSQVLFGEHFCVLDETEKWYQIELQHDKYTGWIDKKCFFEIPFEFYKKLSKLQPKYSKKLVDIIVDAANNQRTIVMGSSVLFLKYPEINPFHLHFKHLNNSKLIPKPNKKTILKIAQQFLETPYLWGGRTAFGIDCSGFTQMVYKLSGYKIPRDASQQAKLGEVKSFIEESEEGDLAFFDNEEGKIIHVGIMMKNHHIIHASGKVRVDRIDHLGIYNEELRKHTHQLRMIKKIV